MKGPVTLPRPSKITLKQIYKYPQLLRIRPAAQRTVAHAGGAGGAAAAAGSFAQIPAVADAPGPARPARDLDTPSFLRRPPAAPLMPPAGEVSAGPTYSGMQDELDIPTFLRKQMD